MAYLPAIHPRIDVLRTVLQVPQLCTPEVLNAKNGDGITAMNLCVGCSGGNGNLQMLVEAGADYDVLTDGGETVLDLLCKMRDGVTSGKDVLVEVAGELIRSYPDLAPKRREKGDETSPYTYRSGGFSEEGQA